MKFKRPAMSALFCAVLATVAHAGESLHGEIIDFGLIIGRYIDDAPTDDHSGLGPAEVVEDIRYVDRTDRIEARLCRRFGISVQFTASYPWDIPREVKGAVLHPTMTRPDGKQAAEVHGSIAVKTGIAYVGFAFNEEWEMVAGRWTVMLSSGDAEIVRKDFTVTVPAPGAPNSDCGAA